MPAGSEVNIPALPHTFRPLGVRIAAYALVAMLFLVATVIWFAFPPEVRAQFNGAQRATVLGLGGLALVGGYALARCRVVAGEERVTIVNGFRARRYDWNELLAVTLRPGNPWAVLDLSDGTSVSALGIQGSDGARAMRQVRELRAMIEHQSRTERDD